MDYAFKVAQRLGAPPMFSRPIMDLLADRPPIPTKAAFPEATFTRSKKNKLPQAIAHRGSKITFPENTMAAFRRSVDDGVDAIETDVHISKDGVIVLSHDPTLERCFGIDKKIAECDWKELSEARTLREPHEPMPRLEDLLIYLNEPKAASIWVLLDIKLSNDPKTIMSLISSTLAKVPSASGATWHDRIILGCWAAKFLPAAVEHLPLFPVTTIGFSIPYSRQFLDLPNVSFNMLMAALVSPAGRRFIADAKAAKRPIYAWTANDDKVFDWSIRKGIDGVITDDPRKYIEFREKWREERKVQWSMRLLMTYVQINLFAWVFEWIFWKRYGFGLVREGKKA